MGNPAQVSGTLDEAGDHLLWFRVAGRLSTVPPHREKETIIASEICFLTATELVRLVRAKELSALEVMEAHLAQIERVNPEVNAIVTLTAERAMDGPAPPMMPSREARRLRHWPGCRWHTRTSS